MSTEPPQGRRPLRVLNVVGSLVMGGTERYLSRIIPILRAEHGMDVEICLLKETGALVDVVKGTGVPIRTTQDRRRGGRTPIHAIPLRMRDMTALMVPASIACGERGSFGVRPNGGAVKMRGACFDGALNPASPIATAPRC